VDGSGNVYIGDPDRSQVLKETLFQGAYTQSILLSSGLDEPNGVAVDGSGNLYIADTFHSRVLQLQTSTVNFGSVMVGSASPIGGTSPAITLLFTFETGGTIGLPAVLDLGAANLVFFNDDTGTCYTQGTSYTYSAGATCTLNVALDPYPGPNRGAAQLLDTSGNVLATAPLTGIGVGPQVSMLPGTPTTIGSALLYPLGMAVDGGGNVFVVTYGGGGKLYKETLSGNVYSQTTIFSGLSTPVDVAVDGSGNLYVTDASDVYKGTLSKGAYSQSTVVTGISELDGIAVDGYGNLYLASGGGNVYKETLSNGSYRLLGVENPQRRPNRPREGTA
jgi:hypothetical protein